jgi:hypothetical protein
VADGTARRTFLFWKNMKLTFATLLVGTTAVLIAVQLFFPVSTLGFAVSAATLVLFLMSGVFLIDTIQHELYERKQASRLMVDFQKKINDVRASNIERENRMTATVSRLHESAAEAGRLISLLRGGTYGTLTPSAEEALRQVEEKIAPLIAFTGKQEPNSVSTPSPIQLQPAKAGIRNVSILTTPHT